MQTFAPSAQSASTTKPQANSTFWRQITALAALEATITIGWLAYEKYQPVLLEKFQFVELAALLIVAQGLLGGIFHPVSGRLADRMSQRHGTKFPVIISGIAFAAVIFIAVSLAILTDPSSAFRWALPVLVILWLAAMSTFHSPAISLVESFAPIDKFPRIAGVLATVFGLIYAIEPFVIMILDAVGLTATFILGGVLLASAGYALKAITERDTQYQAHEQGKIEEKGRKDTPPVVVFTIGFFVGLFKSTIFFALPVFLLKALPIFPNDDYVQSGILLASAVFSIPLSFVVDRLGAQKTMWMACGLALLVSVIGLMTTHAPTAYVMMVAAGAVYGLLSISALPFILKRMSSGHVGWGVGLFYGGMAASTAVITLLLFLR